MNAPDIIYEFYIKDAHARWSIHTDGICITECDNESGVTVNGVTADKMFMMCRNALACKREYSVFKELSTQPYNINAAKEMIAALQSYVDDNTKDADNNTEESK
jgi:hypothetical protein